MHGNIYRMGKTLAKWQPMFLPYGIRDLYIYTYMKAINLHNKLFYYLDPFGPIWTISWSTQCLHCLSVGIELHYQLAG